MRTLIRADCDDLARAHRDPAPDRRRSAADRQQDQDRVGGHRDKGDPRQVLLGGQQAQAVQSDLGVSRARNRPLPVISMPSTPSSRSAA
jgi:hypothetical protein